MRRGLTALALAAAWMTWPADGHALEPEGSRFWSDVRRERGSLARSLAERAELRLVASRDLPPYARIEWVRAAHADLNRAHLLAPFDLEIAFLRARAATEESLLPSVRDRRSMIRLAIARYLEIRARDPEHRAVSVAFDLAILHTRLHDFAAASEEYRRARDALLDPRGSATIIANLAEITMLAGDLERACAYFDEAVELAASSGGDHSLVLSLIGAAVAYDRLGNGARAIELARRARGISGGRITATRAPGVFYEPDEELHYYDAMDALAWASDASGAELARALGEARKALARFLEIGPRSPFAPRAAQRLEEVEARLQALRRGRAP